MENIGAVFEITPTKSTSHLSSSAAPCVLFFLLCLFEILSGRNPSDKVDVLGEKKVKGKKKGESSYMGCNASATVKIGVRGPLEQTQLQGAGNVHSARPASSSF